MIYTTFDTSIAHCSTWQLIDETGKTATYDTHTVYYSMKCDGHLQIHIYIDTKLWFHTTYTYHVSEKNWDYFHSMCCTDKNMFDIKQHAT